jgi:hypothetical protein
VADGVLGVAPEPMSVPAAVPVEPVVPEAPMEVPLPVVDGVVPAVGSVVVLGVVIGVVLALLLVVSLGEVVVDGTVVLDEDDVDVSVAASSFLPQADRDRAAIRARAAHCAIGDLIIRNSLRVSIRARD